MLLLNKQTVWKKTVSLCPNLAEVFLEKLPPKEMLHRCYQDWVSQGREGALPVLALSEALAEREERLKDGMVKEQCTEERRKKDRS